MENKEAPCVREIMTSRDAGPIVGQGVRSLEKKQYEQFLQIDSIKKGWASHARELRCYT